MNLLFVSMSARIVLDENGKAYLNWHMNRNIIERYAQICDSLTLFARDSSIRVSSVEAANKYNPYPYDLSKLIVGMHPYSPVTNFFNIGKRKKLLNQLETAIREADRVIISEASEFYAHYAIPMCQKYNKPYMLFSGGFCFETFWSHRNPAGKLFAPFEELSAKRNIAKAPFVIYVTDYALQNRYPCQGKWIGCSDVEVSNLDSALLKKRISMMSEKFSKDKFKIVLGTAAGLEEARKGQKYVIRALALLKERGINWLEYQLIGSGSAESLMKEAQKYGVKDQVKILGTKPHDEVYQWLDDIDLYIQPSFSEGLCRSVVEAMSRACPVTCSDAGGNLELCNKRYSFKAGNVKQIANCIQNMLTLEIMKNEAIRSFEKAKHYDQKRLDEIRQGFLKEFMQ